MMKRVMCVRLPGWALQRLRCGRPEHKERPLVLYAAGARGGLQVVAGCRLALRGGIRPGMPLAEAKGLLETGRRTRLGPPLFVEQELEQDQAALEELAVWSQRFSPVVGIAPPESLLLDISGCAHLFGGEWRLMHQLAQGMAPWRYTLRMAIADTVGAAWAVAHYGRRPTVIVPPGEQADTLRLLPVAALRLVPRVVETLHELDIRRVEQLLELPRTSLPSRFGSEVAKRLDQALGDVDELITPIRPPDPIAAEQTFEEPTSDRRGLEMIVGRLLAEICAALQASQQGIQRLEVSFESADKTLERVMIGTSRPSRAPEHLERLIRTKLEQVRVLEAVTQVRLEATAVAPLEIAQRQLFETDETAAADRDFAQLIDRISNRLEPEQVLRPSPAPDVQPEYAVDWQPVLEAETVAEPFPAHWCASSRPLQLLTEPIAIDVTRTADSAAPARLVWDRRAYRVCRCWGPERIETGWWRERHIRRDYYRVETDSGQRFWIFERTDHDRWFLHGLFD